MKREAEFIVDTVNFKSFQNDKCEFFPCHKDVGPEFNCLFCYCPLVYLHCPGPYKLFMDKWGNRRKDCSDCSLNHKGWKKSWNFIQHWLELNGQITGTCVLTEARRNLIMRILEKTEERETDKVKL